MLYRWTIRKLMDQRKMTKPVWALTTIRSTIKLLIKQVCVVWPQHCLRTYTIQFGDVLLFVPNNFLSIASFCAIRLLLLLFADLGNPKGTKQNDDNEKKVKKANDDKDEPSDSTPLGEIPKVEKYIANTRIDSLQTLYQVRTKFIFGFM